MKGNKLNFESGNLVVDYIFFNIQGLVDRKQVEIIAKYLFQILAFNSTFAKDLNGNEEDLFFDSHNQLLFYSSKHDTCWSGIKIDFSGKNAIQLYSIIKYQKFDWNILN